MNRTHQGLTRLVKATLTSTITPANARTALSTDIEHLLTETIYIHNNILILNKETSPLKVDMSKKALSKLSENDLEKIAGRFRALGEKSRLKIVQCLHNGEKTVTELVESTGLSQPNTSRHLLVLVNTKLILRRKSGLHVLYRLADDHLAQICSIVCKSVESES